MKQRLTSAIKVILMLGVCLAGITLMYIHEGSADNPPPFTTQSDTIPLRPNFIDQPAKDGLKAALIHYEVKFPEIVYAQAVLETGHFKSVGCLKHHNLFGLYNSEAKRHHRFNHWTESVVAYKEWIQRRYKPPEDYYEFLKRIHYARDPEYIKKLKKIVNGQR